MIRVFEGNTANDSWKAAAIDLLNKKETTYLNGRGGDTEEILHATFSISDPRQRWVTSRYPAINPAFAIAEVVWILSGRNDSAFLTYWNRQLAKYTGKSIAYHGAYGFRLRRHFGIDQLERAYYALSNNPSNRQVVLQIWDCEIDLPTIDGQPVNPDIPCNIGSFLKIRENKLEWMQVLRSNDLFRGVPYNFIQFTSLQEVLAGWLGVEVGTYNHLSDSLHVYIEDINQLSIKEDVALVNTDSLSLPKLESEHAFMELARCIDYLMLSALSEKNIEFIVCSADLPSSFRNMLFIMAAESARRKGLTRISEEMIANCTNPLLNQVWKNWSFQVLSRKNKTSVLE